MKIKILHEFCIGCGLCEELVPGVFRIKGEKAELKSEDITSEMAERVEFAVEDCPGKAIQIKRPMNPEVVSQSGYAGPLQ